MYVSLKSGQKAKELFATLLKENVAVELREGDHISFMDADLDKAKMSAIVRVYANMLLVFKDGLEPITVFEFPLDEVDCIYSL